uniref:Uncharacterized protein n=1 Tax=Lepeophtheirus salmonis TaxID=72036 RepID=A0A0K2VI43_LEPSM
MEYNFIDEEGSEDEGNEDEESNGKGSEDEGIHANCTVEDNPSLLGSNLKEMDQELRRSLTNLTFTPIEDPYDNMEALKSKLVGRDELEIYRMKKLKKQQEREGKEDEVGEAKASSLTSGNYSK